jgi:hypothetical protein
MSVTERTSIAHTIRVIDCHVGMSNFISSTSHPAQFIMKKKPVTAHDKTRHQSHTSGSPSIVTEGFFSFPPAMRAQLSFWSQSLTKMIFERLSDDHIYCLQL